MILTRALAGLRARLTNSTGRSAIVALDLPRSRGTAEEVSVDIENLIVTVVGAKNMHRFNERTVEAWALKRNVARALGLSPLGILRSLVEKKETKQATFRVKSTSTGLSVVVTGPSWEIQRQVLVELAQDAHQRGFISVVELNRQLEQIDTRGQS